MNKKLDKQRSRDTRKVVKRLDSLHILERQADALSSNIQGWEKSTLKRIGKRIGQIGNMSIADLQSINKIAVVKQDMGDVMKELAKATGMNVRQIEQIYADTLTEQHLANKPLYEYRHKAFVPFAENTELQAIIKAYSRATAKEMINLSKTKMLCVRDKNGRFVKLQKGYYDILDKATMQVASGATDFHTAMRESIKQMGSGGLRVDYGGGVTRRLDTVVRQNLLWGAKQASIAYNEMIGEELGCDGIEIDYHAFPRPSHAFMQGKQYVLGKARKCNGIYFESADEALERLEDYNCYHYKTPIICGISEPRYDKKELAELKERDKRTFDIDDREMTGYEASQAMRRLETAVREQKGIKAMAQASGDPLAARKCNERIKRYQDKYAEISDITGIAQDKKRLALIKGADSGKIKEQSSGKMTPITDNAIKNVKKVEISGFNDMQNDYIHNQHKELLKYARDNNGSKEVAFVFRKDLSDKTIFKGDNDAVDFGNALIGKGDGLFVMHNHPNNSSFSSADVAQLIAENNISNISVVKNNGNIEVITKTDIYDQRKAVIEWNRAIKNITEGTDSEYKKAMEQLLKKLEKGGYIKWTK